MAPGHCRCLRAYPTRHSALNRIRRTDPATAARIPEHDEIIAFRNLLIHGYDVIDHVRVWQVIEADLPRLQEQVQKLLQEIGAPP